MKKIKSIIKYCIVSSFVSAGIFEAFSQENANPNNDMGVLIKNYQALGEQVQQLNEKVLDLRNQLISVTKEKSQLSKQVDELVKENSLLKNDQAKPNGPVAKNKPELQKLTDGINNLRKQSILDQQEIIKLKRENGSILAKLKSELEGSANVEKNDSDRSGEQKLQKHSTGESVSTLNQKIDALIKNEKDYKATISSMESNNRTLVANADKAIDSLNEDLKQRDAYIQKLTAEISGIKNQDANNKRETNSASTKKSDNLKAVQRLESKLQDTQIELAKSKDELESQRALKEQIKTLTSQVSSLSKRSVEMPPLAQNIGALPTQPLATTVEKTFTEKSLNERNALSSSNSAQTHNQIMIRPGLILSFRISALGHTELEMRDRRVNPNGTIRLDLLGEVNAGGLSLDKLTKLLEQEYAAYYREPQVDINFVISNEENAPSPYGHFSVMGRVKHPGRYNIPPSQLVTATMAIQMAGGYGSSAKMSKVTVTREVSKGVTKNFYLNLKANNQNLKEADILLKPNDIVYIPETFF